MVAVFIGKEVKDVIRGKVWKNLGEVESNLLYLKLWTKKMFGLMEITSLYLHACSFKSF
jgi:hypothetical protein